MGKGLIMRNNISKHEYMKYNVLTVPIWEKLNGEEMDKMLPGTAGGIFNPSISLPQMKTKLKRNNEESCRSFSNESKE